MRGMLWGSGLVFGSAAIALVLMGGCGSDDGSGDDGQAGMGGGSDVFDAGNAPDRNDVQAGELCQRYAEIICAAEAFCCDAPGRDRATCTTAVVGQCNRDFMVDQFASNPIVSFNATAASAAFTELENRASMCDRSLPQWAVSQNGFAGTFDGTIAADGDCTPPMGLDSETVEVFAALASCQNVATTACLPADPNWTCAPRAAAGGSCRNGTDLNCADGLYCDDSGTCAARKAVGESCSDDNECASLVCSGGTCADDAQAVFCPR